MYMQFKNPLLAEPFGHDKSWNLVTTKYIFALLRSYTELCKSNLGLFIVAGELHIRNIILYMKHCLIFHMLYFIMSAPDQIFFIYSVLILPAQGTCMLIGIEVDYNHGYFNVINLLKTSYLFVLKIITLYHYIILCLKPPPVSKILLMNIQFSSP